MDPTGNEQQKSPFVHRGLSAELINELFGSLPFENGFRLLTKMPNGLLARNVQKMLKNIKMAMKENKLDKTKRARITEDGLIAACIGYYKLIQAVSPIPPFILRDLIVKPTIVFYFEMQILRKAEYTVAAVFYSPISVGFEVSNSLLFRIFSIKISHRGGMEIDESFYNFENDGEDFVEGDFVGLGIIHHPSQEIECFSTCNEKLLGKAVLPPVYQHFKLFPTARLSNIGDTIRFNFGKDEWEFKEFGLVL